MVLCSKPNVQRRASRAGHRVVRDGDSCDCSVNLDRLAQAILFAFSDATALALHVNDAPRKLHAITQHATPGQKHTHTRATPAETKNWPRLHHTRGHYRPHNRHNTTTTTTRTNDSDTQFPQTSAHTQTHTNTQTHTITHTHTQIPTKHTHYPTATHRPRVCRRYTTTILCTTQHSKQRTAAHATHR